MSPPTAGITQHFSDNGGSSNHDYCNCCHTVGVDFVDETLLVVWEVCYEGQYSACINFHAGDQRKWVSSFVLRSCAHFAKKGVPDAEEEAGVFLI